MKIFLLSCLAAGAFFFNLSYAAQPAIPSLDDLAGDWNPFSSLRSLPAINSPKGGAKCTSNVLAMEFIGFPPVFLSGATATLRIDGADVSASEARWYPYQALRRGTAGDVEVETTVRLLSKADGMLFRITLRNKATTGRKSVLQIDLNAPLVREDNGNWNLPVLKSMEGFTAKTDHGVLSVFSPTGSLTGSFAFSPTPDVLKAQKLNGEATWNLFLAAGETKTIELSLVIGKNSAVAAKHLAEKFDVSFSQAKSDWETLWREAFEPGNPVFSGNLPTLVTGDQALRRVYYMAIASLLSVYRDSLPAQSHVFVSNSPEYNATMMYFWDTREWATLFALLDPQMLRHTLLGWFAADIHQGNAYEYLGGTIQGSVYSANDYSVFLLATAYLGITGDRVFLQEKAGGTTVLDHLNAIALHWKELVRPGRSLANYGAAKNLLECVPNYVGEVPSFNGANVWMMRQAAAIDEAVGQNEKAASLRKEAAALLPNVMDLYEPGEGVWSSFHDDGTRAPLRHVFDFATLGLTLPHDLDDSKKKEMITFVKRELLTDTWMRAQSLQDSAAGLSDRPDHGPMGAFSAWPAETAAVFCEFGDYEDALGLLHRVALVTKEGPFSQSRELLGTDASAPARIASRGYQAYNASNGASFAETIICNLFGYAPTLADANPVVTFSDAKNRGFSGELLNVRFRGALYNLKVDASGRQMREK
jgi:hypothetical protein